MYTPRYVSLTLTFPELPQFEFFFLQLFPNSRSISHNNGNGLLCTAQTLKCNWISHKRRTAVFTSYTQNSIPPRIFLRSPCLKPLRCVVLIDYHAHKVHRDKIMVSKKVTPHANLSSLPWGEGGKALSTFISFNSAATHTTVILKPLQCFCYSQFPDTQISFDLWTSFLPDNLSYSIFVDLPSQTLFPSAWYGAFPPNWRLVADIPPDVPHCGAFLPEHYGDVLPV